MLAEPIRVAILEDHPAMVEGYQSYLRDEPDIQVVATAAFGEELPTLLATYQPIHLLLLDIWVPTSPTNRSPYPIVYLMPQLLQRYPKLNILVISLHKEGALIKAVMDAGASGFVLKDDRDTLQKFPSVLRTVAGGGIYFSREAHQILTHHPTSGPQLSPRQAEVLSLCAAYPEKTTAELAHVLGISDTTVRNTLSLLYLRLGVRGRTAAIAKARELGLLAETTAYPLADQDASLDPAP
jgi:DNA-binding NarL/FixJ family response regulator